MRDSAILRLFAGLVVNQPIGIWGEPLSGTTVDFRGKSEHRRCVPVLGRRMVSQSHLKPNPPNL